MYNWEMSVTSASHKNPALDNLPAVADQSQVSGKSKIQYPFSDYRVERRSRDAANRVHPFRQRLSLGVSELQLDSGVSHRHLQSVPYLQLLQRITPGPARPLE